MAWWAWLLSAGFVLLLLTGLLLLLPLRIFVCFLRENRKDNISLKVKLAFLVLRLERGPRAASGRGFTGHLAAGRMKIPAAFLQKAAGKMGQFGLMGLLPEYRLRDFFDLNEASRIFTVFRQTRPLLKKVTWSHFDLEISWGWDDPALTGLAAGGCWAFGGALCGLLREYFSVTARPRFLVQPLFSPAGLRLRWEAEVALSLYRCLRLWCIVNKQEV